MLLSDYRCEECGEQATAWLVDVEQLPPDPGSNWLRYKTAGPMHCFCATHERPSLEKCLDGRVGYWRDVDPDHQEWQDWNGGADAVQQAE